MRGYRRNIAQSPYSAMVREYSTQAQTSGRQGGSSTRWRIPARGQALQRGGALWSGPTADAPWGYPSPPTATAETCRVHSGFLFQPRWHLDTAELCDAREVK